ncbi:MAG TPA: PAS domain-containing sensor histidine kinase [Xanthobacteraceae bacterium]|nr:PAS domain-containing sensor histidine kinase [Xanthobacteraceae bacterium]
MSIVEKELALLRHPRLAALATSAWPAWLWSADGARIVWSNAAGAALFGAPSTTALAQRRFDARDVAAAQIIRLAATLPSAAQERLERLRGFGAGFGRALTCACSRIVLADGKAAVLVVATESAGPALTLGERVRRLFADSTEAIAAFAPEGMLIYANAEAQARLDGATMLSALGLETLAATALETGTAGGVARSGASFEVAATRLGEGASRVLVVTLPQRSAAAPRAQNVASAPVPPPPEAMLQGAAEPEAAGERRHPLRFVWHMDADGRFGVGSDEFIDLVGPRTMAAFGRPWSEIAAQLELDPKNEVARAVASRDTWSGIIVSWPVDDSSERLPVEMSGLPVFDRDRSFRGYRGFGVCRDIGRINQLARARRERPMGFLPAAEPAARQAEAAVPETTAPAATASAAETAPQPDRPAIGAAPVAANVVPFRPSPPAEPKAPAAEEKSPALSPVERRAFRDLAQELAARLREPQNEPAADGGAGPLSAEAAEAPEAAAVVPPPAAAAIERGLLDRIPIGVLVYRHDRLLYANRHFLEWSGYESLAAIEASGGLNTLFAGPDRLVDASTGQPPSLKSLSIATRRGDKVPVEGRMFTVPWNGSSALALILTNGRTAAAPRDAARAFGGVETESELNAILEAATDGVITLDGAGRIVDATSRAAALFGKSAAEMAGRAFGDLLAPDSERAARDYFDRIVRGTGTLSNVLDVTARAGDDRLVPLAMTLVRVGTDRICAVFRDLTSRKQNEEELRNAKREALRAASAKAEFLAKVSHEIRTPLNAMTGFAEVIMAERFGPIGNERYREYVKDIHNAGTHLVSMLNDLLDLSRIETGQVDLTFANVNLNALIQQCVGIMQPQANRARIIIRTSLTPGVPLVVADERSLRQIVINLISNSIRFTGPGGQVIVSTVFSDSREAILRVRDTGVGMSEKDIAAALEPFRQIATSGSWGSGGAGFGLPLTKALAEANRAHFSIKSAPNAGTLVEIAFPPSRIIAG